MFGLGCCGGDVNHVSAPGTIKVKPPATPMLRGNLVRSYQVDIENDYYIGRDQELGKGGCGVVVYGEHKETHAQYAIKIINKATAERGRLDRELKLLKDVDHANIVRLFSVYDTPSHMYFVMELCLGGHLGNLLARQPNKYLDEDWAKKLCRQILSAVAHIHSRGIAHRDIKLQNILIDSTNDRTAQVKLIDFGYGSRFVGALPMRTKCGTPYTTAPEVIRENYDERCDVWSVGVVLYIMLCGRRPFEALDIAGPLSDAGKAAMITSILAGRYHLNHKPWQNVSRAGINFVKTLLHQDYRTRVRSSEALENPWLNDAKMLDSQQHALVSAKSFNAVSKIIQAQESTEMQRTGMVALVFGIQAYAAVDLRAVFQSFDADGSGTLSRKEFQRAIAQLAPELSNSDIDRLFDMIDIDKNKQISYTEFLVASLDPREVDLEELNKAFKLLDEDGNGYISRDELRKVIKTQIQQALENSTQEHQKDAILGRSRSNLRLSSGLSGSMKDSQIIDEVERRVNAIFDEVDVNNDGCISHAEFLWAMTGLDTHLTENEEVPGHNPGKGSGNNKEKSIGRQYKSSPNLNRQASDKGVIKHQRSMGAGPAPQHPPKRSTLTAFRNALQSGIGGNSSGSNNNPNNSTASPNDGNSKGSSPLTIETPNAGKVDGLLVVNSKESTNTATSISTIAGGGCQSKNGSPQSQTGTNCAGTLIPIGKSPVRKMPHALSGRFAIDHGDNELPSAIEEEDDERGSVSGFSRGGIPSSLETMRRRGSDVIPVEDRMSSPLGHEEPADEEAVVVNRRSKEINAVEGDGSSTGIKVTRERALTAGSPANVTPPNYTGILAHNHSKFIPDTFTSPEASPRSAVVGENTASRTIAFYSMPEDVGGVMRDDHGINNEDHELSSSSYDADKVASLFGPPPSKKYNFGVHTSHKGHEESSGATTTEAQSGRGGKSYVVEDMDATPLRSPKFRRAESTDHSESASGGGSQPISLGTIGKSKSLKTSTIIDSTQGVPIKMVQADSDKSKSPFGPPKPKMSRAPSLKRDISDKFLDITGGLDDDHLEERSDAEPVPPPFLARNPSARAFSMSSILKRDAEYEHTSNAQSNHDSSGQGLGTRANHDDSSISQHEDSKHSIVGNLSKMFSAKLKT